MSTIIVTTDFSATAANALDYACHLAKDYNARIMLVHIYEMPVSYTAEAGSLAAIDETMGSEQQMLRDELTRIKTSHPEVNAEAQLVMGDFVECLQQLKQEHNADLVVMGAVIEYAELWLGDPDWLNALVSLTCPVLVVPKNITYKPIRNIALACDYKKMCVPGQVDAIKNLVNKTGASFYMVHVSIPGVDETNPDTNVIKDLFRDIRPQYHTVENKFIIRGIVDFIRQHQIDLLLVIPRKHGFWYNVFNKRYTAQLALLNDMPVMAVHEGH